MREKDLKGGRMLTR